MTLFARRDKRACSSVSSFKRLWQKHRDAIESELQTRAIELQTPIGDVFKAALPDAQTLLLNPSSASVKTHHRQVLRLLQAMARRGVPGAALLEPNVGEFGILATAQPTSSFFKMIKPIVTRVSASIQGVPEHALPPLTWRRGPGSSCSGTLSVDGDTDSEAVDKPDASDADDLSVVSFDRSVDEEMWSTPTYEESRSESDGFYSSVNPLTKLSSLPEEAPEPSPIDHELESGVVEHKGKSKEEVLSGRDKEDSELRDDATSSRMETIQEVNDSQTKLDEKEILEIKEDPIREENPLEEGSGSKGAAPAKPEIEDETEKPHEQLLSSPIPVPVDANDAINDDSPVEDKEVDKITTIDQSSIIPPAPQTPATNDDDILKEDSIISSFLSITGSKTLDSSPAKPVAKIEEPVVSRDIELEKQIQENETVSDHPSNASPKESETLVVKSPEASNLNESTSSLTNLPKETLPVKDNEEDSQEALDSFIQEKSLIVEQKEVEKPDAKVEDNLTLSSEPYEKSTPAELAPSQTPDKSTETFEKVVDEGSEPKNDADFKSIPSPKSIPEPLPEPAPEVSYDAPKYKPSLSPRQEPKPVAPIPQVSDHRSHAKSEISPKPKKSRGLCGCLAPQTVE